MGRSPVEAARGEALQGQAQAVRRPAEQPREERSGAAARRTDQPPREQESALQPVAGPHEVERRREALG
jgi:hypothetical protein